MKTIFRLALSLVMLTCVNVTISAQNTASGCYRGFVDAGYTIGVGDYDFGRFEVNTTHGYQINPYFFVGAGVGMHFMPSYKTSGMSDIPLARGTFMKSRFAPFIDVKGGTYVNNNGGLYYNISAGLRIAVNEKQAVDISVGYTNEKLEFQTFSHFISDRSLDYTRMPEKYDTEGIAIKIGYEF